MATISALTGGARVAVAAGDQLISRGVEIGHGFAARCQLRLRCHGIVLRVLFVREDATVRLTAQGICSYFVLMDFENLGDVWQAGARLYVRCAKPRRDGLKSVRSCGEQLELDVRTLLWTRGKAFPISMLSSRMRCPKMRLARGDGAADAAGQRAGRRGEGGEMSVSIRHLVNCLLFVDYCSMSGQISITP